MLHKLITGTSLSGKSTMAKALAREYKARGRRVLVLDPMLDPEWDADFITDDPGEFMAAFWNNRELAVFIDEAGESVGRYDKEMIKTATKGRHWGHICHYVVNRVAMLSRDVRGNCGEVYAFACAPKDAETLAEDFIQPEFLTAPDQAQGEYIHAVRFGKDRKRHFDRGRVF